MAVTIDSAPNVIGFSRNKIEYQISSNRYVLDAGQKYQVRIAVGAFIGIGDTLIFEFQNGEVVTLTGAATSDDSGSTVEITTVDFDTQALLLVDAFEKNYIINSYFDITTDLVGANSDVYLTAKIPETGYEFTFTSSVALITKSTTFPAQDRTYNPNFAIACQVYVEEEKGTGIFTKLPLMFVSPDTNGVALIDIADRLNSFMSIELPAWMASASWETDKTIKKYYCEFSEYYGDTPYHHAVLRDSERWVIKGGVSKRDYPSTNGLVGTWFFSQAKLLSWFPTSRKVTKGQHLYIGYAPYVIGISYRPRIVVTWDDTTTTTHYPELTDPKTRGDLAIYPVGFDQLSLAALQPTKEAVSYTFCLVTGAGATEVTEVRTYILDDENYLDRYFLFEGTLGGVFESLRCFGIAESEFDNEKITAFKPLAFGYTENDGEETVVSSRGRERIKVSTGAIASKVEVLSLKNFLLSRAVYLVDVDAYIPVVVDADSFKLFEDDNHLYGLEFTYAYANVEDNYSDI